MSDLDFGKMFSNSKETSRDPGLPVGSFIVAVYSLEQKMTKDAGGLAALRYNVISTNNPDVKVGDGFGEPYFLTQGKYLDTVRGRFRAVVRAIAGLPENATPEQIEADYATMVGPSQAARGIKLRVTCFEKKTRDGGKDYIARRYDHIPQTTEEIVATRRWLETLGSNAGEAQAAQPAAAPAPAGSILSQVR